MDSLIGRVFGSCFRVFSWQQEETQNKQIYHVPDRKSRYKDQYLKQQLSDYSSFDLDNLADDEYNVDGQIAVEGKLQLHDNVFVNPLNSESVDKETDDPPNEISEDIPSSVTLQTKTGLTTVRNDDAGESNTHIHTVVVHKRSSEICDVIETVNERGGAVEVIEEERMEDKEKLLADDTNKKQRKHEEEEKDAKSTKIHGTNDKENLIVDQNNSRTNKANEKHDTITVLAGVVEANEKLLGKNPTA